MTTSTALITGATGGLGIAYAHEFARLGHDLILVARREAEMETLAEEIRALRKVDVQVLPCDLDDRAARRQLMEKLGELAPVDVLVNNAGFGAYGKFVHTDPDKLLGMLGVNCEAMVDLTRFCLTGMLTRDRGSVINVASTAGFQPLPDLAVYAATKAFVVSFTQALWTETKDSKVRVMALCPGATETPFWEVADAEGVLTSRRTCEQVVETTIKGIAKNSPVVIDGPQNAILANLAKIMPYVVVEPMAKGMVKRH